MLFNSVEFLVFFAVVYSMYLVLQHRAQNLVLLVASYIFYGWWDWRFLSLIWLSTTVDWFVALRMDKSATPRHKRRWLMLSLAFNLGLLGTFKYAGFFARSLTDAFLGIGYQVDLRFAELILPVGISFYTFQSLSYTVDVYRGDLKASRSLPDFALFVGFFPQLVAGPIERATHFLPQVQNPRRVTFDMLREGAWLILLGFFKKVVLADNMTPYTTRIFENPADVHGLEVLVGIYAFAFQIYGDFSGYSDIARGTAKLMGFDLMHNFRMPYFAINPSDFWRRWHISLSSWLRDYLYISLGGNRLGSLFTYRNLLLTMVLGGLWHGAAYNFVAWGVFHGAILCIHRWLGEVKKREPRQGPVLTPLKIVLFFHVTCLGWLLFGVKQLSDAPLLLKNMLSPFELNGLTGLVSVATFAAPILLLDWLQNKSSDMLRIKSYPKALRACVYIATFAAILLCGATGAKQFIYFQF
jgi:D-alanyl-lipoteichoic acid acyltransferase DltB (MBOAT superfamily)